MPVTKPTARRIFDRVAQNGAAIDRPRIVTYLEALGLGSGLFGGKKVAKGADAFLKNFDTSPEDGKVTWQEFVSNSRHLLPPALSDGKGRLNPALIPHVFDEIAGAGAQKATRDQVAAYIEPKLTGAAALFSGTIAEATAKVAIDALDGDGDNAFTRDDLESLVKDINSQLGDTAIT